MAKTKQTNNSGMDKDRDYKPAKASIDLLNELHCEIALYYIDCVKSGEDLSSGTLAAINSFLKTNEITADLVELGKEQNFSLKLKELIEINNNKKETA